MGRLPLHTLIWSKEQRLYELYAQGQLVQRFQPAEEAAWLAWLHKVSSFAFHRARGSLNVFQEQRPRGGAYCYAYQTREGRTRKRYLGQTESLSFSRLEETTHSLLRATVCDYDRAGNNVALQSTCSAEAAEYPGEARTPAGCTR